MPDKANEQIPSSSTGATTEAAGQTVAGGPALSSGERWQHFTAIELSTIVGALDDSGGMHSHSWYLRCSALETEIIRAERREATAPAPAPDSTRKRDGVAGDVQPLRPREQGSVKGPSLPEESK